MTPSLPRNQDTNTSPGWADLIVTSLLSKGACTLEEERSCVRQVPTKPLPTNRLWAASSVESLGVEGRVDWRLGVDVAWLKRIGIPAWHQDRRAVLGSRANHRGLPQRRHSVSRFGSDTRHLGSGHRTPGTYEYSLVVLLVGAVNCQVGLRESFRMGPRYVGARAQEPGCMTEKGAGVAKGLHGN